MAKRRDEENGQFAAFEATDHERELVGILAGEGVPYRAICRFVKRPVVKGPDQPINLSTLRRHFRDELKQGREIADATIVNKAYEAAIGGNVQMLIHLTKVRLGWKEPATEVNLRTTYGELVHDAVKRAAEARKATLTLVTGSKPDDTKAA